MSTLSRTFLSDIQRTVPLTTLNTYKQRIKFQTMSSTQYNPISQKSDKIQLNTPSTASTFFRKTAAIDRGRRPKPIEKSQHKIENQLSQKSYRKPIQRKTLTDRAVYYGPTQLPYLHSSDTLNSLYSKQQQIEQQPLINPPPSISSARLVNVKFLYLYYTNIQSLRQLGTGWSNLRSLTIMCSGQLVDLGGSTIFPNLQYLFVAHNSIREVSDVMYHSSLRCLDLEDNLIDLMEQIQYLYTIPLLQWININHNPIIEKKQNFRIIGQNLGNKLQPQPNERLQQYLHQQEDLERQLLSYQSINNNTLIKEINEQLRDDAINERTSWRRNTKQLEQIDFVTYKEEEEFILTPLFHFHTGTTDTTKINKYFHNKVNIQQQQEKKPIINAHRLLSNTSEQKKNISNSLKKRSLKFSLAKTSTIQEKTPQTGSKFLKKRSLLKKPNLLD